MLVRVQMPVGATMIGDSLKSDRDKESQQDDPVSLRITRLRESFVWLLEKLPEPMNRMMKDRRQRRK